MHGALGHAVGGSVLLRRSIAVIVLFFANACLKSLHKVAADARDSVTTAYRNLPCQCCPKYSTYAILRSLYMHTAATDLLTFSNRNEKIEKRAR